MALSSIQYLTLLIPIGIFLAVVLALSRMYRDSEMAALDDRVRDQLYLGVRQLNWAGTTWKAGSVP